MQFLLPHAGLSTALVESYDFSSGTSSRSTKLIHGGVRYLQKAVFNLDIEQYRMVKEALHERANLLKIAPHLSHPLPIMLPVYKSVAFTLSLSLSLSLSLLLSLSLSFVLYSFVYSMTVT